MEGSADEKVSDREGWGWHWDTVGSVFAQRARSSSLDLHTVESQGQWQIIGTLGDRVRRINS